MTAYEAFMSKITGWSDLEKRQLRFLVGDVRHLLQHMSEDEKSKASTILMQMTSVYGG